MYVFTSDKFSGNLIECTEGNLEWVNKEEILKLNIWEGDKIFLEKINNGSNFFTAKFVYKNDTLISSIINEY